MALFILHGIGTHTPFFHFALKCPIKLPSRRLWLQPRPTTQSTAHKRASFKSSFPPGQTMVCSRHQFFFDAPHISLSDLQSLLSEVAGDVELAATRISEGEDAVRCSTSVLTPHRPCRAVGSSNAEKGQEGTRPDPYFQGVFLLLARRLPWRTGRLSWWSRRLDTRRRCTAQSRRNQRRGANQWPHPFCYGACTFPKFKRMGRWPPVLGQGTRIGRRLGHRLV
jgi:hypothetical protein